MEHFVWNVDPEIFRIGSFGPRWYGLMFAIGFLVGYQVFQNIYRFEGKKEEDLSSLLFHVMIGTIVGARLGHCLFYEPGYYLSHPLEILAVWKGGLASHGGTAGVLIAVWLYCKKHPDQPFMWIADRIAAPTGFVAACIRMGNFFNSEIVGKPTDSPLGIVFARVDNVPRHPAMLYESVSYLILSAVLYVLYFKRRPNIPPGSQIGIMFIWIFTSRFFLEFVKENQVSFESGMPLNMGQILSIPFVLLGIFLVTGAFKKYLPESAYSYTPPTTTQSGKKKTKK